MLGQASPCNVSLDNFPPMLVLVGECESLRDQASYSYTTCKLSRRCIGAGLYGKSKGSSC